MPPDAAGPSVVIELVEAGYLIGVPAGDGQIELPPTRDAVIPKVRAQLRRVAGDLFTPHTVPIGPYHHDKDSWLWTQEKKRAVQELEGREVDISGLKQVLDGLQSRARRYYTHLPDDHAMDSEKFCSMLLHDGCYLLGFFVEYECQQPAGSPSSDDRQTAIGSSDNTVARDILYLLENQIPLFVIFEIFEYSKAQGEEKSALTCIAKPVEEVLQKQLYISKTRREPSTPSHLLDLVYSYLASQQEEEEEEEPTSTAQQDPPTGWWRRATEYCTCSYAHLVYSYLASQHQQQQEPTSTVHEDPPTGRWRRATEYRRYADLLFKPRAFHAGEEWTILAVRLHGRSLSIPHLRIDSHTWTLLRNLMALEEHREARPVTAYCYFMSQVACTAEDVELLRSAKVIEHFLGSDESAAQGFAGLCHGVALDIDRLERNYLKPIWHDMEKRCGVRAYNFKGFFREKYCSNVFYPVVFFIAFVVFGCQVVQSIYQVIAYHKPNNKH